MGSLDYTKILGIFIWALNIYRILQHWEQTEGWWADGGKGRGEAGWWEWQRSLIGKSTECYMATDLTTNYEWKKKQKDSTMRCHLTTLSIAIIKKIKQTQH